MNESSNISMIMLLVAVVVLVALYYNEFREKFQQTPSKDFIGDVGEGDKQTLTGNIMAVSGSFGTDVDAPQFVANVPANEVTGWKAETPLIAQADTNKAGASFAGAGSRAAWSHFPWSNGHTYIRPGQYTDKNIYIDGAKHVRLGGWNPGPSGQVAVDLCGKGACSHFPWVNGDTYIRPGQPGKNIHIGDWAAKLVKIGNRGNSTLLDSHWVRTRRHIDADIPWVNGKSLFMGWVTDKTIVGNHKNGAHDYAAQRPANTVTVTNPLHVHNQLCIGNTCIGEGHLKALKGDIPVTLRSERSGNRLMDHPNRVGYFSNKNRAQWERMYLEACTSSTDRFPGQTSTCP
jgi:hypothetical protein